MKAKIFEVVLHKLPSGKSPATAVEEQLNEFLVERPQLRLLATHMRTPISPAGPNAVLRSEEALERQPQVARSRKIRNRLASNNRPLAILAGPGRKTISRTISREPIQASRPRCKAHGAAVEVVQVATPVRPSPLAKGDLKCLKQAGLRRLERRALGWPSISWKRKGRSSASTLCGGLKKEAAPHDRKKHRTK